MIFKFMSDKMWEYRIISYVVAGLGLLASLFFLTNVKEVILSKACHEKAEVLKEEIAERKQMSRTRLNSATEFSEDEDGLQVHASKRVVKA